MLKQQRTFADRSTEGSRLQGGIEIKRVSLLAQDGIITIIPDIVAIQTYLHAPYAATVGVRRLDGQLRYYHRIKEVIVR